MAHQRTPEANARAGRRRSLIEAAFTFIPVAAITLLCIAGAAGCSLFEHHGPPPQRQFLDALNHGNAAQASQIWLHMDAHDRANFSHSVGLGPSVTAGDVKSALLRREQEMALHGSNGEDSGGEIEQGDINSQMIDMPGLDVDTKSGSLTNLPNVRSSGNIAPEQLPPGMNNEP